VSFFGDIDLGSIEQIPFLPFYLLGSVLRLACDPRKVACRRFIRPLRIRDIANFVPPISVIAMGLFMSPLEDVTPSRDTPPLILPPFFFEGR